MKKILLGIMVILLVFIIGCGYDAHTQYMQETPLEYFKDDSTGLCFAASRMAESRVLTCVPCDSLNKIKLSEK
jgi:uncharacterized protein YxeA